MSKQQKVLLIYNIVIVIFTAIWWGRDEGFEPIIALISSVGSLFISIYFNEDKGKIVIDDSDKYELLDKYPDLTNEFKDVVSFKMIGTNYQTFVTKYMSGFLNILGRGGKLYFIGCETTQNVVDDLTYRSQSSSTADVTRSKIENFISTLRGFNVRTPSLIELKLLPYPPPYGLIMIEKRSGESKIYFKPYTFRGEGKNPVLIFDKKKDQEWYSYFNSQFDKMWDAVPVKTIG